MISSEVARIQYTLTSTGQTLSVPFYFLAQADLKVVRTREDVDTTLVLNTDYTVTGAGVPAGGTVVMEVAAGAVDDVITIYRYDAITQPAQYPSSGQFPSATVEQSQDRLTMLVQQLWNFLQRTLRVPVSNAAVDEMTVTERAGKLVGFDANGDLDLSNSPGSIAALAITAASENGVEQFNVQAFGAAGDGVTDDTVAIQAAIDAAQAAGAGNVVFFPPHDLGQYYKTTASLVVTSSTTLRGAGSSNITILGVGLAAGQYIIKVDGTVNPNLEEVFIENLTLRSNNGAPNGLKLDTVSNSLVRDVVVRNLTDGVVLTGNRTFSISFDRLITNAAISGSTVKFNATYAGGGQIVFCGGSLGGAVGLNVVSGAVVSGITLNGTNFEGCTTSGIFVDGTVNGLTVSGCRFEKCTATNSLALYPAAGKSVSGIAIIGCYFETDAEVSAILLGGNSGTVRGFLISGNYAADYSGQFVNLNGDGQSGLIVGNKLSSVGNITNGVRPGVAIFNNEGATTNNGQTLTTPLAHISGDRGDTSPTLTPGTDATVQRFATNLTANRTVTLAAGVKGDQFRVVRTGLGAFTLDVGGLKTIAGATAAFVDVEHDGTAWRLTGYGAL